jgi:hypothetical protein
MPAFSGVRVLVSLGPPRRIGFATASSPTTGERLSPLEAAAAGEREALRLRVGPLAALTILGKAITVGLANRSAAARSLLSRLPGRRQVPPPCSLCSEPTSR